MSVYVDDVFIPAKVDRYSSRWCHLTADTPEELHAFAARLGLRRSWAQHEDSKRTLHYDVTEGKRQQAIKLGAIPITWREMAQRTLGQMDES